MAKRPDPRRIRSARSYTVSEVAETLDVAIGTVRAWLRKDLPALKDQRPTLIVGEHLRGFLEEQRAKGRLNLGPTELLCLGCKCAREPLGRMVDALPQTAHTVRLEGICPVCGKTCNRMVRRTDVARFGEIFDVAFRDSTKA